MQVKFQLELVGEDSEVRAAILPLLRALTMSSISQDGSDPEPELKDDHPEDATDHPEDETEDPRAGSYWTSARAEELVSEITDKSRLGLRAISESAPVASFDVVLEALGTDGPTAGGIMGSISYAAKRIGTPLPFDRDYRRRVYLIHPDVARVFLGAIHRAEQPE